MRLSNQKDENNPDFLVKVLRMNRISHHKFNPTYENNTWSKHFKSLLNKRIQDK